MDLPAYTTSINTTDTNMNLYILEDSTDYSIPPSPPPMQVHQYMAAAPHAPSPGQEMAFLKPRSLSPTVHTSGSKSDPTTTPKRSNNEKYGAVPTTTTVVLVKQPKCPPVKQSVTLDEVEREILKRNAHLPADTKKKMAKAEFKRLKHCETVRQSRVRKKNQRKDLREVNEELEQELHRCLITYRSQHNWMEFDESSLRDVLFKKFVHSIYEVRGLRHERSELKDQLMVFDTLGEHFQRLQDDFRVPRSIGQRTLIGTIHFQELSVEEAREIMMDSHAQATSFFESMRHSTDVPEDQEKTMGWSKHQRITSDGRVQFNFTKRIYTICAHDLVDKSWEMYCDFNLYHGIYSSVQKYEILQKINEDTLLIRRDLQEGSSAPIFRTIFLLFRIKLEHGYLICFRSHNPRVYIDDDDDPNVQWMDMFYWLMVTDPPGEPGMGRTLGCDVTFGGNLLNDRTSVQHAIRWKYQIAMALLRWESNAVAPLFSLLG